MFPLIWKVGFRKCYYSQIGPSKYNSPKKKLIGPWACRQLNWTLAVGRNRQGKVV